MINYMCPKYEIVRPHKVLLLTATNSLMLHSVEKSNVWNYRHKSFEAYDEGNLLYLSI